MKTKSLIMLSVSVLVLAFLTLGCTSVDNALNNPTPVPTITQSIPDTPVITPTDTPTDMPVVTPTDVPTDIPVITPTDVPTVSPDTNNSTPDTSGDINQTTPDGVTPTPTPDAGST